MKHTPDQIEILGTQSGTMPGQIRVFVDWPTRKTTPVDASLLYQNGKYGGNSGNIPAVWLPVCKVAAAKEIAAIKHGKEE